MKSRTYILTASLLILIGISLACSGTKRDLSDEAALITEGKNIAAATFTALSTELQAAVSKGGVSHALSYCQVNANPLVDSLSETYHASISRKSPKFRNPDNKPNEIEASAFKGYQKMLNDGEELKPQIVADPDGGKYFFAPIQLNEFCLKCHGNVKQDIANETIIKLKELYPEDLATGYAMGELRGIWSIKFN